MSKPWDDHDSNVDELMRRCAKFIKVHPELEETLGLWMADRDLCTQMHPEAVEIFEREFPDV